MSNYLFNMVLKKLFLNRYVLETNRGIKFHDFYARSETEALEFAYKFMSSWHSVIIVVEAKDEKKDS